MAGQQVVEVTDSSFQSEVLDSKLPVVVDFWASWCGPCRMQAPIVEQLAAKYSGQLKVAKLNVDENPESAGAYGVQSIPTLILFRAGQEAKRLVGLRQLADLERQLCADLKPAQS